MENRGHAFGWKFGRKRDDDRRMLSAGMQIEGGQHCVHGGGSASL
jgi:hypothetical protein